MSKLKNFRAMWDEYPTGSADEVKKRIGGQVDAEWLTNTCTVRVSRSFNYSGNPIPNRFGLKTVTGADGLRYAFRVRELLKYLRDVYGPPGLTHTYPGAQGGPTPEKFTGKQGVICFEVQGWSDASGHFDLWDGARCINHAYFERAAKVHLWEVPEGPGTQDPMPQPIPPLLGSVGRGGVNRAEDVRRVQSLLVERGLNPGPVDGVAGQRTIAAIVALQRRFMRRPDGRVDPNGRTWRELNGL